ncbi:hypothetical protein ACVN15_23075, partial [Escherichia coli]
MKLDIFSCIVWFVNEKTTRQGGFFEGSATGKFLNRGNWLGGAQSPKLFFQFSLNWRMTSRLTPLNQLPVAAAIGAFACLFGLDSSDSYRNRRSSRTERGV